MAIDIMLATCTMSLTPTILTINANKSLKFWLPHRIWHIKSGWPAYGYLHTIASPRCVLIRSIGLRDIQLIAYRKKTETFVCITNGEKRNGTHD